MAATIQSVKARQIFDSCGNPTVEVDVCCSDGTFARAAVPSGASTGVYEALELRDGGSDYLGKGVSKAVNNVNSIIGPALIGKDPTAQIDIDNFMVQQLDGTKNEWGWCKQKLGANAILAVSLAVCKAGSSIKEIPLYQHIANLAGNRHLALPVPAFNVINGGSHAGNKLAVQEFMILPTGAASFKEAMKMGVEVYHNLKSVITKKYGQDATNVGDDGGFAPNIQENKEVLELLKTAIEKAGYTGKVVIGMDVAASEFYNDKDKTYDLNFKEENNDGSQKISGDSLKNVYKSFVSEYPIVSIEDPFDQDDWVHYAKMTEEIGEQVQIVGGDLLVTNPTRVAKAIKEKSCNALLLKVNQVGSVTESIEAVKMSKHAGWGVMTSHRSGETEDTFIADLAVGLSTGQIKTGAPCRSEHLAKYNQLLRIEEELGAAAVYAGAKFRSPMVAADLAPPFILLDPTARVVENCKHVQVSSAAAFARGGEMIRVSLQIAEPPAISHLLVSCNPSMSMDEMEASVVGAEGPFVFIRLHFLARPDHYEYLMYLVVGGKPLLRLSSLPLKRHRTFNVYPNPLPPAYGIMPRDDGNYVVAWIGYRAGQMQQELGSYSSESNGWKATPISSNPPCPGFLGAVPKRAISVDADQLLFVDADGILMHSQEKSTPTRPYLKYIDLPEFGKCDKVLSWDVGYANGLIKAVQIKYHLVGEPDGIFSSSLEVPEVKTVDDWALSVWERAVDSDRWSACKTVTVDEFSVTSSSCSVSLKEIVPICPVLCVNSDSSIIYMKSSGEPGFIIGVDLGKMTIITADRTSNCSFISSAISEAFSVQQGMQD